MISKRIVLAIAFLLPWIVAVGHVAATHNCGSKQAVTAMLAKKYRELPVAFGIPSDKITVWLYMTETASTFTLVTIYSDGRACIIAAGDDWEEIPVDYSVLEPAL